MLIIINPYSSVIILWEMSLCRCGVYASRVVHVVDHDAFGLFQVLSVTECVGMRGRFPITLSFLCVVCAFDI